MKKLNTIMAVALAATFAGNVIAAEPVKTQVPGLPTGYTFTDSGLSTTDGFDAMAGMNIIVDSFAMTGGSTLTQDKFWAAFIGDPNSPETFFDYAAAKPAIEELVYTVQGKTFHAETTGVATATLQGTTTVITFKQETLGGEWLDVDGVYSMSASGMIAGGEGNFVSASASVDFESAGYHEGTRTGGIDWATTSSVVSNGTVQLGDLDQKGLASRNVLEGLGFFTNVQDPLNFGKESSDYVYETRTNAQIKAAVLTNSATIKTDATAARVDGQAYVNAVNLLRVIADANVEENILDVDKATRALAALVAHHNTFLSASLRSEAEKLKQIMQNNAYLTSASILGQTATFVCEDQTGGNIVEACTILGGKFDVINTKVETNGSGSIVDNNAALVALSAFVTNLVDFDGFSSSYVAADAATVINFDYGVIAVDESIAQGSISDWSDSLAIDVDLFDATFLFEGESADFN